MNNEEALNSESSRTADEQAIIDDFCLLDDDFMTIVFDRNIEAIEFVLRLILGNKDLKVRSVVTQREYRNPVVGGRSITLDALSVDESSQEYDVEVQRESSGADPHRARFHSSMLDTRMLKEKQDFKEIHDSYVIFITEHDVLKAGKPIYHIKRTIEETAGDFKDGSHIIYVNGAYKNEQDPIGKLVHDFKCKKPDDMYYEELAQPVKYFKESANDPDSEGGHKMSEAAEKVIQRRAEEMFQSRAEEVIHRKAEEMLQSRTEDVRVEMVGNLLRLGKISYDEIAQCSDLPLSKVEELAQQLSAVQYA